MTELETAAKATDQKPESGKPVADSESDGRERRGALIIFLAVAALVGVAAFVFWMRQKAAPDQIVQNSVKLLDNEDYRDLRVELTKLEGVPDYELHQRALTGAMLVREGSFSEAESLLAYLPEEKSLRSIGLHHRGIVRFKRGDFKQAEVDFEAALETDEANEDSQVWLTKARAQSTSLTKVNLALEKIREGNIAVATRILEQLEEEGADAYADVVRGNLQIVDREYKKASDSFERAGLSGIKDLREASLLGTAKSSAAMGDFDKAISVYSTAIVENMECIEAHKWLATKHYTLGAMEYAIRHLEQWADLLPEDPVPLKMLGFAYLDGKRPKMAIPYYERSFELEMPVKMRNEILIELAEALILVNRFDDATKILDYETLNELKSGRLINSRDSLRARCLASEGNSEEAFKYLDKVLAREPSHLAALSQKGELMLNVGDLDGAVKSYEAAAKHHRYDMETHFRLGQVYRRSKRNDEAEKIEHRYEELKYLSGRMRELDKVASSQRANTEVRIELGKTAYQLGNTGLAEFWLKSVRSIDRTNQEAIRLMEMLNTGKPLPPVALPIEKPKEEEKEKKNEAKKDTEKDDTKKDAGKKEPTEKEPAKEEPADDNKTSTKENDDSKNDKKDKPDDDQS